jgi:hypothetical protein
MAQQHIVSCLSIIHNMVTNYTKLELFVFGIIMQNETKVQ